jgi:hypothetical protein
MIKIISEFSIILFSLFLDFKYAYFLIISKLSLVKCFFLEGYLNSIATFVIIVQFSIINLSTEIVHYPLVMLILFNMLPKVNTIFILLDCWLCDLIVAEINNFTKKFKDLFGGRLKIKFVQDTEF